MGFIKELILRSKLKSNTNKGRNFLPWDKIKTVALIVDDKHATNKNELDKFIYETDKVVDVYYLDLNNKESSLKNYITFVKTNKSFFGLPNAKATAKIQNKKYDLLINAAFEQLTYAGVLSNAINATCKSGFENKANELDLLVVYNQNKKLIDYLNEVVNYLKMIKN